MKHNQYFSNESLGYLSGKFSSLITKRISEKFNKNGLDLTSDQWTILVQLWSDDGISQRVLSDRIHKDKSFTARTIKSLEDENLLFRITGAADGREKFVFLSDKGKIVAAQAVQHVSEVMESSYAGISLNDLRLCENVMRLAYENLK